MEDWSRWAITGLTALWLGSLTWIGNRQVKRIDHKAGKDDLAAAIKRLDEKLGDDKVLHNRINDKLDNLTVAVARLEGKVNGRTEKTA